MLGFRGLPTRYRLIPSERNPATALARSLRTFAAWSFEQHRSLIEWLVSLPTGHFNTKMCYKHIWESPCQIRGYLRNLGEECRKIRNAKSLANIWYTCTLYSTYSKQNAIFSHNALPYCTYCSVCVCVCLFVCVCVCVCVCVVGWILISSMITTNCMGV